MDAVRIAGEGGAYFDPVIAHVVLGRFSNAKRSGLAFSPLTPRETEILRLISDGHANAEIAERLHIGLGTVKGHIRDILEEAFGVRLHAGRGHGAEKRLHLEGELGSKDRSDGVAELGAVKSAAEDRNRAVVGLERHRKRMAVLATQRE